MLSDHNGISPKMRKETYKRLLQSLWQIYELLFKNSLDHNLSRRRNDILTDLSCWLFLWSFCTVNSFDPEMLGPEKSAYHQIMQRSIMSWIPSYCTMFHLRKSPSPVSPCEWNEFLHVKKVLLHPQIITSFTLYTKMIKTHTLYLQIARIWHFVPSFNSGNHKDFWFSSKVSVFINSLQHFLNSLAIWKKKFHLNLEELD